MHIYPLLIFQYLRKYKYRKLKSPEKYYQVVNVLTFWGVIPDMCNCLCYSTGKMDQTCARFNSKTLDHFLSFTMIVRAGINILTDFFLFFLR